MPSRNPTMNSCPLPRDHGKTAEPGSALAAAIGRAACSPLRWIWSFVGKVDVVATASGKVIPSGNVKIIQPIEIGYVRTIHVRNGQHVEAGQLLVGELDPTLAGADAAQASQGLQTAEVVAARNAALLRHVKGGNRHV